MSPHGPTTLGNAQGGAEAERGGAAPAAALPCLSSNNSTGGGDTTGQLEGSARVNVLTGGHKRSAFVLVFEIMALAKQYGIERLGFMTLTFADLVLELKEANRRFNSLNTHVLKERYVRGLVVPERQRSRRVHFHLLVVLAVDIRTGVDFEAFARKPRGDYRSAGAALRAEWAFWRRTAPAYGFGRTELLPIRSTAQGIARYVGKYISKHVRERVEGDKGARLVRYLGFGQGGRKASCRFGWNNDNGWLWRHKLAAYAERNGARDTEDLVKLFGPRWAYRLQAEILAERIDEVHPSRRVAERSYALHANAEGVRAVARDRYESGKLFKRTFRLGGGNKIPEHGPGAWPE
jgi:hypothetical protein